MYIFNHKVIKSFALFLGMLVVAFLAVSCRAKPVIDSVARERAVVFSVNWKNISPYTVAPGAAKLWLYPEGGLPPIVIDIPTDQHITKTLPLGNYQVIIRNDNLSTLKTRGMDSFDTHEAYLETKPQVETNQFSLTKLPFQGTQDVIDQADFVHSLTGSSPRTITVGSDNDLDVAFYPQTITSIYRLNLQVSGSQPVESGLVRLNNLATSVNFATGKLNAPNEVAMEFPLTKIDDTHFQAIATALGANPEVVGIANSTKMQIHLQFADPNIAPITQSIDLSDELNDPNTNLDINVIVDPENNKPFISVQVEAWKEKNMGDIEIRPKKK